jgi:hypothetical protein
MSDSLRTLPKSPSKLSNKLSTTRAMKLSDLRGYAQMPPILGDCGEHWSQCASEIVGLAESGFAGVHSVELALVLTYRFCGI